MRALLLRRRFPYVFGPLVLGVSFHMIRHQMVANDSSSPILLNAAQVSARLRAQEDSVLVDRGNGVLRYDFTQLGSNNPIEDDHSERILQVPLVTPDDKNYTSDWHFWGIFDGHGGSSTSKKLKETLIPHVISELNKVYPSVSPQNPVRLEPSDPDLVDQAIVRAFTKLDKEIVHENVENLLANPSHKTAIEVLPPALSGSCALLAFYDSSSQILRLALVGDSRAVLGFKAESGQWQAKALTADQTGSNLDEVKRIRSEHPPFEQQTCVRRGRLLGIYEPTRSFGDAAVKWSRKIHQKVSSLFFSSNAPPNLLTPPYMTSEPVITRTKIDPNNKPCFMVLASDGLFEMLGNDQVVALVVDWLQHNQPARLSPLIGELQNSSPRYGDLMDKLGNIFRKNQPRQIGDAVEDVTAHKEMLKHPVVSQNMNTAPLQVAIQDKNVATHLVRNALGGNDHEQVSLFLSIPSPMSRNYRDDLTLTVIFFGNQGDPSGGVYSNPEASHIKSKL